MHQWAIAVERTSGRLHEDLKSGRGPKEVLELFEAASEAMALEEQGLIVEDELIARIATLRARAAPWLRGDNR